MSPHRQGAQIHASGWLTATSSRAPRVTFRISGIAVIALCLIPFLAGCLPRATVDSGDYLALVNGESINLDYIRKTFKSDHGDIIVLLDEEGSLARYLERAINLKLLAQEAHRVGLDREREVDERVEAYKLSLAERALLEDEVGEAADRSKRRAKRQEVISQLRASAGIETRQSLIPLILPENGADGSPGEALGDDEILARVGEEKITARMLKRSMRMDLLARLPRAEALRMAERKLERLVDDLVLKQEAARRGYTEREEILAEARIFEERLIRERLYREAVSAKLQVDDEEAKAYYLKHPDEFTVPERRHVSHILVKTREDAVELAAELRRGAEFERLALTRSIDEKTSQNLGRIGWIQKGQGDAALEEVAFSLNRGETSGIVETERGFHIIRLDDVRKRRLLEFEQVKALARRKVHEQKRKSLVDYWIKTLRERSDIEINQARVEEVQRAIIEGRIK